MESSKKVLESECDKFHNLTQFGRVQTSPGRQVLVSRVAFLCYFQKLRISFFVSKSSFFVQIIFFEKTLYMSLTVVKTVFQDVLR